MPPRFERLIHTRLCYRNKRTIPAMMLTTATIVAVGLFLATMSAVRAHEPTEDAEATSICDGDGSGTLFVGPGHAGRQSAGSKNAACQFSIRARLPLADTSQTDCQVSYTTVESRPNYVDVAVLTKGSCDGVRIYSSVTTPGATNVAESASAQSSSRQALAKIVGHDVIDLPMFWHYSKAYWSYTSDLILSAQQEVNRFADEYWHTHSTSSGKQMNTGNTRFRAWDSVSWHSDGYPGDSFPDVYAESRVEIIAEAGGGYACDFEHEWTSGAGNYPDLHFLPHAVLGGVRGHDSRLCRRLAE